MGTNAFNTIDIGQGVTLEVFRITIDPQILRICEEIFQAVHSKFNWGMKIIPITCNENTTFCESGIDLAELCTALDITLIELQQTYKKIINPHTPTNLSIRSKNTP